MAIIVSAAQLFTAREQKTLAGLQARVAEANALPQFEIAIHQLRDEASGIFEEYHLIVKNDGGPIHELHVSTAVFARVQAVPAAQLHGAPVELNMHKRIFLFASCEQRRQGAAYDDHWRKEQRDVQRPYADPRDLFHSQNWGAFVMNEYIYAHLTYRDLIDRSHDDYYEVPYGGWRVETARFCGSGNLPKMDRIPDTTI
jgi:hypothetical protein